MKRADDLSFSSVVNLIQGETARGAELLDNCALELEEVLAEIKQIDDKMKRLKSRASTLCNAGKLIAKHLEKELPLAVKRKGYIIVVSEHNLTIERNVI